MPALRKRKSDVPLLADFFPADEQRLDDGTRLRPFVSGLDAPLTPINGSFIDRITLTQARLPATSQPGSLLPVELHWQESPGTQKLFLHLIAPDGTLLVQDDRPPEGGFYPTSAWDIGELVVDHYTLTLPPDAPEGQYRLLAGLYRPETAQRLQRIDGGGDAVELGTIEVRQ